MNGKDMGPSHKNPYDLLYQLGVSANYKGFFHTAHAVTLCMQQQERLLLVTKWLYPDVATGITAQIGKLWNEIFEQPLPLHGNGIVPCWKYLLKDILRDVRAPQNSLRSFSSLFSLKSL